MFRKILLGSLLVVGLSAAEVITGKVVHVADGDTLSLLDNNETLHRIRLSQIDAPEKSQDFGKRSRNSLRDMCMGKTAKAEVVTTDKYGRTIATVYCNDVEVNIEQVRNGWAWAYTKFATDKKYIDAQRDAKAKGMGLWGDPNAKEPWEFRKHPAKKYGQVPRN